MKIKLSKLKSTKMKKAQLFKLAGSDFLKGGIMALLTAFCTSLLQLLNEGHLPTIADLKTSGIVAITAFIAYLLKNFVTNSDDKFLKKETSTVSENIVGGRPDDREPHPKP